MNKFEVRKPNEKEYQYWMNKSTIQQAKDRAYINDSNYEDEYKGLLSILPQLLPEGKNTKGHHFRVLDTEYNAIGFIWFGVFPGIPEDMIILMDIMLEEKARSKGLGRKLLTYMHNELKTQGPKKIYLEVKKDNYAKNLYRSLGYKTIEEQPKNLKMILEL